MPSVPVTNPFGIPGFGTNTIPGKPDVVFKRGVTFGAGRLFGVGGLIITAAELLIDQIEKKQERDIERRMDDADEAAAAKIRRQREVDIFAADVLVNAPAGTVDFPMSPPDVPAEPFRVFPRIPLPEPVTPTPQTQPLPEPLPEIQFPEVEFGIGTTPAVQPAPLVIPNPTPVPAPVSQPFPGQFESPSPFGEPSPEPLISPIDTSILIGDLLPDVSTAPLTGVGPGVLPSAGTGVLPVGQIQPLNQSSFAAQPFPTPSPTGTPVDRCPPRTCEDDLDEPRLECFKGLYRENLLDTDFTAWTEIDCITGKEL